VRFLDEHGLAAALYTIITICWQKAECVADQHGQNAARRWRADAIKLQKAILKIVTRAGPTRDVWR
jgi:hypothetical protein